MFDYVSIQDGKIVERIQQSDTFGQMITLYGGILKKAGIALILLVAGLLGAVIWLAAK